MLSKRIFYPAKNFFSKRPPNHALIGSKAEGLSFLPQTWTPDFFLVTTNLFTEVKDNVGFKRVGDVNTYLLKNYKSEINKFINELAFVGEEKLIIRSSSTYETIEDRGRYDSKVSLSNYKSVIKVISSLYVSWNKLKQDESERFAVIIQIYKTPVSKGHLSNERRISYVPRDWKIEYESSSELDEPEIYTFKLFAHRIYERVIPEKLFCSTYANIKNSLHFPAQETTLEKKRIHFEWIWDGSIIWLVQADEDKVKLGENPRDAFDFEIDQFQNINFNILNDVVNCELNKWQKAKNVIELSKCGLTTSNLWIIDDREQIEQLCNGKVSEELELDIDNLLVLPIVVRTDLDSNKDQESRQLLPRTNTLFDFNEVIDFIKKTAVSLSEQGFSSNDFCFLFHHFIPSTSSAYCFASPNNSKIRLDSLWGLPDGLSFYPHDSFELDLSRENSLSKLKRYKEHYLSANSEGKWIKRTTGEPWDWNISISSPNIYEISKQTKKFADYMNAPVRLMWFVDVRASTGYPKNVPWYYEIDDIPTSVNAVSKHTIIAKYQFVIRNHQDIKNGALIYSNKGVLPKLLLDPNLEFLRDKNFLSDVAKLSIDANVPVILQGSILQHAYYQLKALNAKVQCPDPLHYEIEDKNFGKLVRDKIPEQIKSRGEKVSSEVLSGELLEEKLRVKIFEEANEVYAANSLEETIEEIADLQEIVSALIKHLNIDPKLILKEQLKKKEKRGGFDKGVVLLETSDAPLTSIIENNTKNNKKKVRKKSNSINKTKIKIAPIPIGSERGTVYELKQLGLSIFVKYEKEHISLDIRGPVSNKKKSIPDSFQMQLPFPKL